SPYGWHKYYGELLCKEYHTLYQVRTCFLRPFSVYGPGLRKQLLWDLFPKSRTSSKIELFGTGNETRDFIYIDDLVQAIALVIEQSPFDACAYNVASGTETSIEEIASSYLRSLNPKAQLSFNNITREGDP